MNFGQLGAPPCVAALSDLVQLQEKYRVEVIGIAARERARTAQEAATKLDAWLTEKLPNLNYRIGFNYTREMDKLWMESSFSVGIPTSFVVDRDGRIAFRFADATRSRFAEDSDRQLAHHR
ncbi:TlpA disulfide reductase family protein [Bradyrhizobium sp. Ghvi]|uniref:TlpA disulfide reductase family protein n=1 Tax=Bradyrhizobium sp. Ghvi TaxID=1855319 RepID=UPI0032DF8778